jgi:hypothetical protein
MLQRCPYCEEPIRKSRSVRDELETEKEEEGDARPWGASSRQPVRAIVSRTAATRADPRIISIPLALIGERAVAYVGGAIPALIGLALAIPAWVMGRRDLAKMQKGEMDPEGQGMTQGGMICGIVGTALNALGLLLSLVMLVFLIFLLTNSGPGGPFGPPPVPPPPPPPPPPVKGIKKLRRSFRDWRIICRAASPRKVDRPCPRLLFAPPAGVRCV